MPYCGAVTAGTDSHLPGGQEAVGTEDGPPRRSDGIDEEAGAVPALRDRSPLVETDRRRLVWACAALAALPAVVAGVTSVGADVPMASDYGPIELMVRDVTTTHPPLVGAFTRLGGSHPGPAGFFALAVPYRVLGSQPWALLAGAAAVNAVAIALAVRIAGRRARVGSAAVVAGLSLASVVTLGPDHLRDPWNPHLPLFPFLLACVATWAVVCGSRRSLPVAVVAASFCVQNHFGYALLVIVLGLWWVGSLVARRRDWRRWLLPVSVALLAAALMWAPPVLEELGSGQGNLTRRATSAGEDEGPAYGMRGVRGQLLIHLGPTPAWFTQSSSDPLALRGRSGLTSPPLGALGGAAAIAVALWRRRRDEVALVGVVASLWLAGAVSVAQITGLPVPYLYLWVWVLGILLWWAILWILARAAWSLVRPRLAGSAPSGRVSKRRAHASLVAGGALLACLAVGTSVHAGGRAFADYRKSFAGAEEVAERVADAVDSHPGPTDTVDVRWGGPLFFEMPAVVAELERSGHHVRVDPGQEDVWGSTRLPSSEPADLTIVLGADPDSPPPGGTLVASATGIPSREVPFLAWLVDDGG
ncbi:hypothetical protein BH24ACT4_BH24ACT4_24370 [soil metagenome]